MFSSFYLTMGAMEQRQQQKLERKLRIPCLHGWNNDAEVMGYQMRHFRQVFSEVMDFVVIDGPFECESEPLKELRRFLDGQNRTRFKEWLRLPQNDYDDPRLA